MTNVEKKKRVHKSPEQRQAEILTAATKVFAERGYQVADTQAIADLAGVGKGTLYRYFPTKEKLFSEALHRQLDILRERLHAAGQSINNPLAKIKAVMGAYFLFFDHYPETIELFAQERAEFGSAITPTYFERMRTCNHEWVALFQEVIDRFPVRDISIDAMMARFSELMHGAGYMSFRGQDGLTAYQQLDDIFEFYLHGILRSDNPTQYLLVD
ncbi:TetR/AcrR family transcriptional regulator [Aliidiomarina quisquiliarum]|uniref:TetR/AcrR family transcriptional regulator n=1 Tax=Aliidiomarina quisquiliarum TaxID=2938947 RepID=UPI00208FBC76|nr:TetR/AcrR family transcriptional regulator [Aliidiomarina quisquiliarum]MCO4321515.1 TetR/AcrR family transcriptional regulator [Aliidiomarina quisquiliarum]